MKHDQGQSSIMLSNPQSSCIMPHFYPVAVDAKRAGGSRVIWGGLSSLKPANGLSTCERHASSFSMHMHQGIVSLSPLQSKSDSDDDSGFLHI